MATDLLVPAEFACKTLTASNIRQLTDCIAIGIDTKDKTTTNTSLGSVFTFAIAWCALISVGKTARNAADLKVCCFRSKASFRRVNLTYSLVILTDTDLKLGVKLRESTFRSHRTLASG